MMARLGVGLGLLLTAYVAAFLAFALVPRVGAADLAVVLGNEVLADGQPSARLAARLDCAVAAYRRGLVPRVLVSGGVGASGFSEAVVMRAYLVRAGVPEAAVLMDEDGVNTAATVRHTVAVMDRLHVRRVLVVTQWFHVPRCVLGLRRAGVGKVFAIYPRFVEWRDLYSTGRELVAVITYAAASP